VSPQRPFEWLYFDGERLSTAEDDGGRRFGIDTRCLRGDPVPGAYAHVCASSHEDAAVQFDQPEVQHARREALAWWIPRLGDSLVCLSTLTLDSVRCGGAVTVARDPALFAEDPFARLFPGIVVRTDMFCSVLPPTGPVIERYAGAPWPGGGF